MEAINSVQIELTVVLGRTSMPIQKLLKLGRGAVIELDTTVHDEVEVHANNTSIAFASVIVEDDNIGVRITHKRTDE